MGKLISPTSLVKIYYFRTLIRRQKKMGEKKSLRSVQVFGRKKTSTAVAHCKAGKGLIKVNGRPLALVEPRTLRQKLEEPVLLLGKDRFSAVDIRVRVNGGGHIAQVYAIRQAISKGLVAYYQKYVDEASKKEIKDILIAYDRSLLVADPRRNEPKKFGGPAPERVTRNLTVKTEFDAIVQRRLTAAVIWLRLNFCHPIFCIIIINALNTSIL